MNERVTKSSVFDFSTLAGEYDNWYKTAEGRLYDMLEKRVLRRLIGEVGSGPGMLEVGMGTGWWSRFFVQLGYHVTGVDISSEMVKSAQSKHIPNATFEITDAQKLPFGDGCFDAAAAITSIEFTREPEAVVREMVRCSKPGGKLFFGVLNGEAPLNKLRKMQAKGPFATMHSFTTDKLRALLAPFGQTTVHLCAFPVSIKLPLSIAGMADDFQALLKMTSGAFIAARVQL